MNGQLSGAVTCWPSPEIRLIEAQEARIADARKAMPRQLIAAKILGISRALTFLYDDLESGEPGSEYALKIIPKTIQKLRELHAEYERAK